MYVKRRKKGASVCVCVFVSVCARVLKEEECLLTHTTKVNRMCVFICSRQELSSVEFLTPTMPRDFPKSIGTLEPRM